MAHTVDEVNVLIKAQTEQFQAEIDRVNQKLNSISKAASTASGGVSGGFKNMGLKMAATGAVIGVVSAVTQKAMAAIASSTGDAVKRFDTLKNFPRVMGNLGISAQDSQASIDYLSNKLEGLPTTLDAATTAVQRFTATNGNLRASTAIYLALNNAILAGGADAQQQASAMEQLQQAYAKGKPEMQDWKTLMQTMPAQLKQIANAMGYMDSSQLYDALQDGKTSMDDFMRAAVKLNKEGINGLGSFEQQAAGATGGVATSFMNMQNAIVRGITACMNAIGQSNIAGFFNVVKDVILTAANYVAAFIKLVLTAINAVRALFGLGSIGAKNVASSGGQAANSMANVGKAAQGSTKDIGDTTKAAKKLQKQLAGFDEMNVLSKQDSGGSGGSGKSGGGGSVTHDTSGLGFDNSDIAKGVDKVNAIFEKLKNAFKDFNFDNIGKAIKRFGDDIDKFIKPAKKILSDVWDRIKPFIDWAGNELLPAFLNTLGGAIRLVGRVLESAWGNYLKPFIDSFLIPIANFTGGIIVGVLNGIGDAMRGLAESRGAVEVLSYLITTIGGTIVAWQGYQFALGVMQGIQLAMNGAIIAGTTAVGGYAAGLNIVAAAQGALGIASTALSNILNFVTNPAFLVVAAVVGTVTTAFGIFSAAQKTAEDNEARRMDGTKLSTEAQKRHKEALDDTKRILDELSGKELDSKEAELNYLRAVQDSTEARKKYNDALRNGKISTDDLRKLQLDAEIAELRVGEAKKKSDKAQKDYNDSLSENKKRQMDVIVSQKLAELSNLAQKGDLESLRSKIVELSKSEQTYTDNHGKQTKFAQKDTEQMARTVAEELLKLDNGAGKAWGDIWRAAEGSIDKLNMLAPRVFQDARRTGQNFGQGFVNGVNEKGNSAWSAGYSLGQTAFRGLKAGADVHSPSKAARKVGDFVGKGLMLGLIDSENPVMKRAKELGEIVTDELAPLSNFSLAIPKIDSNISKTVSISHEFENIERSKQQIQLNIKIDGKDVPFSIDGIIDGINDQMFLSNRGSLLI